MHWGGGLWDAMAIAQPPCDRLLFIGGRKNRAAAVPPADPPGPSASADAAAGLPTCDGGGGTLQRARST
eukprot:gene42249-39607_t